MLHLKEEVAHFPSYKPKVKFMSNKKHLCLIQYTQCFCCYSIRLLVLVWVKSGMIWSDVTGGNLLMWVGTEVYNFENEKSLYYISCYYRNTPESLTKLYGIISFPKTVAPSPTLLCYDWLVPLCCDWLALTACGEQERVYLTQNSSQQFCFNPNHDLSCFFALNLTKTSLKTENNF